MVLVMTMFVFLPNSCVETPVANVLSGDEDFRRQLGHKGGVCMTGLCPYEKKPLGTSLATQWLRLCTSNVGDTDSILGQGTKIPHATWYGQKKKSLFLLFIL